MPEHRAARRAPIGIFALGRSADAPSHTLQTLTFVYDGKHQGWSACVGRSVVVWSCVARVRTRRRLRRRAFGLSAHGARWCDRARDELARAACTVAALGALDARCAAVSRKCDAPRRYIGGITFCATSDWRARSCSPATRAPRIGARRLRCRLVACSGGAVRSGVAEM